MKYSPTDIARQFLFVHELNQNHGLRVEAIQRWSGGQPGDSWCCEFTTMVLDICFQGLSPIGRYQRVQDVYQIAKQNHWLVTQPVKDDLFIYVNSDDHAHHIGIFTDPDDWTGISGNTSANGLSSNGDRVAEHHLGNLGVKFIRFPK
jgi:hypothetical protein